MRGLKSVQGGRGIQGQFKKVNRVRIRGGDLKTAEIKTQLVAVYRGFEC